MSYISKKVRSLVISRAGNRCEYCRVLDYLVGFDYHIEHIIGVQHGGTDELSNLAYACSYCNWKKGPNLSTILYVGGELIPLYNPRSQIWFDHFEIKTRRNHSFINHRRRYNKIIRTQPIFKS